MPGRNSLKKFEEESYYHVYNRGADKADIFREDLDYNVFLSYLKEALEKPTVHTYAQADGNHITLNFFGSVTLVAYCLMPNHYHLLLKQKNRDDIPRFMRSVMTRYARYFNAHHQREGTLFQGRYRAVKITTDEQLLWITRYIHRNPLGKNKSVESPRDIYTQPSSYNNFLGLLKQAWICPDEVLVFFTESGFSSYQKFVESDHREAEQAILKEAQLDSE